MNSRIVIADRLPIFIEGLKSLLQDIPDYTIVGVADDTGKLISVCQQTQPDIVIIDYIPEYFDSEELITFFRKKKEIKLIILSGEERKWNILKSLELNVFSYLTKNCTKQDLLTAIKVTAKGEKYFCDFVLSILLENKMKPGKINLSEREMEITKLIAGGQTNKQIADFLNLSPHTIHTHRKNILKKTGTKSALELSEFARENGFL